MCLLVGSRFAGRTIAALYWQICPLLAAQPFAGGTRFAGGTAVCWWDGPLLVERNLLFVHRCPCPPQLRNPAWLARWPDLELIASWICFKNPVCSKRGNNTVISYPPPQGEGMAGAQNIAHAVIIKWLRAQAQGAKRGREGRSAFSVSLF